MVAHAFDGAVEQRLLDEKLLPKTRIGDKNHLKCAKEDERKSSRD